MPPTNPISVPGAYSGHANPTAAYALDQRLAQYAKSNKLAPQTRGGLSIEKVNQWRQAVGSRPLKPTDVDRLDHLWELLK